jgi:hypothetical protein
MPPVQWSSLVVGNMTKGLDLLRHGDSLTAGAAGYVVAMVMLPDGSGMYFLTNKEYQDADKRRYYVSVVYKVRGCG